MIVNSQLRHRELMGRSIQLTDHFRMRYKERVSKGSRHVLDFAKSAYTFGKDIDAVKDKDRRKYLQHKVHDGRACRVYRGFVLIFELNRAITVFPITHIKPFNKEYTI